MIIKNDWIEEIETMKKKPHNYVVMDLEDSILRDTRSTNSKYEFEQNINILYTIKLIERANRAYSQMGLNKEIEYSILYEVLKALNTANKKLNIEQFEELVKLRIKLDNLRGFVNTMSPKMTSYFDMDEAIVIRALFKFADRYINQEFRYFNNYGKASYWNIFIHIYWQLEKDFERGEISIKEFYNKLTEEYNVYNSRRIRFIRQQREETE